MELLGNSSVSSFETDNTGISRKAQEANQVTADAPLTLALAQQDPKSN
jgi:hypothetical protein